MGRFARRDRVAVIMQKRRAAADHGTANHEGDHEG